MYRAQDPHATALYLGNHLELGQRRLGAQRPPGTVSGPGARGPRAPGCRGAAELGSPDPEGAQEPRTQTAPPPPPPPRSSSKAHWSAACPPSPRDASRDAACDATRKPARLRAGAGGAGATGARGPRPCAALAAGCSRRGRRVCSARPGARAFPSGRLVVGFRAGPGRGDFEEPVWTHFRDSGEGRPHRPGPG